jgi:hypothetical protein
MTTQLYEASVVEIRELGSDKVIRQKMVMCSHCGQHFFEPRHGFYFCDFCCGPVCCEKACLEKCVPLEQWMENVELGRAEDFKPSRIFVPPSYNVKG